MTFYSQLIPRALDRMEVSCISEGALVAARHRQSDKAQSTAAKAVNTPETEQ